MFGPRGVRVKEPVSRTRRIRWAGREAGVGVNTDACRILAVKRDGKTLGEITK